MKRDLDTDLPEDRDATAGEYVLGTLDAAARAAFERELAADPRLQASVYAWQDRLLVLAGRAAPVVPDAGLWAALEARLPAVPIAAQPASVAPAANDPLWQRLRRWQAASALGLAASVVLATVLVMRGSFVAPVDTVQAVAAGTRFVAVLEAQDKSTGWLVEATAGGALRLIPVANAAPVPAGKTLQFWTKADGAAGPTSLGLVRVGQALELPASSLPTLEAHQLFELTLEPETGSPIGRPTGPVVYIGRTVRL